MTSNSICAWSRRFQKDVETALDCHIFLYYMYLLFRVMEPQNYYNNIMPSEYSGNSSMLVFIMCREASLLVLIDVISKHIYM